MLAAVTLAVPVGLALAGTVIGHQIEWEWLKRRASTVAALVLVAVGGVACACGRTDRPECRGGQLAAMRPLFRGGAFRWVWAGQSVSMFGDQFYGIGLAWLALTLTGSPLTLATVLLVATVPRAVLALPAGVVCDRVPPRTVILVTRTAQAILCGALVALLLLHRMTLPRLYLLSAVFGAADAFITPASGAVVPSLVGKRELGQANALMGVSEQVAMTAGPGLGGLLVAAAGPMAAFAVDGVSFAIAALSLAPVRIAAPARNGGGMSMIGQLREGVLHVRRQPQLRVLFVLISFAALTYAGIFGVGLPTLARFRFHHGAVALGILGTAWGVGQLLGASSAAITGLPRRRTLLVIGMTCCEAAAFAALGLAPALWEAAGVLATLGFGVAYSTDVAEPTIIQESSRPELLGRVYGVMNLPRAVLGPVSTIAFGAIAARSPALAFIGCAGVMLVSATVALGVIRARANPAERPT